MAQFDIKTRKHGVVTFQCRDDGGYVRVYSTGGKRWGHRQPCEGGGFMGSTLMADSERLEKVARKWWRQFLAFERRMAL